MSYYTGKNVLVTGGSGICGQTAVRRLLDEGANVRATTFTNRTLSITHPKLTVVKCDLMKMEDCVDVVKDMDIVINLVAYIKGAGGQTSSPMSLVRNNLYPTINMIEAACTEGVERFGFVGSSTMYPDVSYPVKEIEAFDLDPSKVYTGVGWMKRYCEKMCMYYHSISKTKFAMIRTTAIYGPHDNFNPERCHVIPDLIMRAARLENPFEIWGDGTQIRDFIYVDDLVDGLFEVIEKHPNADPINIATGEKTTVKTLSETVVNEFGYTPTFVFNTSKPIMIPVRLVSVAKATSVLGWKSKVSLKEGIQKTVNWYKQNYK